MGRNLIRVLRERGAETRALARSDQAADMVGRAGAEAVRGDLDDVTALRSGISGCDVVFHAAARQGDVGSYDDFYRANVAGTENVIAAARASQVPRLVHVSTEAVLAGGGPIVNVDETRPRPAHPRGLYPISKGLAEERVLAANSPELTTVVVRPRLVWGKGDTIHLPRLVESARRGAFLWINHGRYLTSTCHVTNLCEGLMLAAERAGGGRIYFLTDGAPIEYREFIGALLGTVGVEPGNRSIPGWAARSGAWAGEVVWRWLRLEGAPPLTFTAVTLLGEEVTVIDEKARRELGYRAIVTREEGLSAMAVPQPLPTSM